MLRIRDGEPFQSVSCFLLNFSGISNSRQGSAEFCREVQLLSANASLKGLVATGFWLGITFGRVILGFVTGEYGEKLAIAAYLIIWYTIISLLWQISGLVKHVFVQSNWTLGMSHGSWVTDLYFWNGLEEAKLILGSCSMALELCFWLIPSFVGTSYLAYKVRILRISQELVSRLLGKCSTVY